MTPSALLVDENPHFLRILDRFISEHSESTLRAVGSVVGGRDTVPRAERLRPDVILLDLAMPDVCRPTSLGARPGPEGYVAHDQAGTVKSGVSDCSPWAPLAFFITVRCVSELERAPCGLVYVVTRPIRDAGQHAHGSGGCAHDEANGVADEASQDRLRGQDIRLPVRKRLTQESGFS